MSGKSWIVVGLLFGSATTVVVDSYLMHKEVPPVPDKRMHLSNGKGVEMGAYDNATNKFELAKNVKCEDAIVAAISWAQSISMYHENFKKDILSSACADLKKKYEEPAVPVKK